MSRRVLVVVLVASLAAAASAYVLRPDPSPMREGAAPTLEQMARAVGAPILMHLKRGSVPGRSGEVIVVPRPHNYLIGQPDYTTIGTGAPWINTSHPNPWSYLARVPIIVRGPGAAAGVEIGEVVDVAGIAPSYARLLDFDFPAEGRPLPDLFDDVRRPPKAVVTVVIDGGGWNVLAAHPSSWPTLRRLRVEGTTYTNATIGSAPSITGAVHATIGTGTYPATHGLPGNVMRSPENGEIVDVFREDADPRYLERPTLVELWDEAHDNEAVVGMVGWEGWHLGMIGHGAQREGGDRDLAVIWNHDEGAWWINQDFYELPKYLHDTALVRLARYEERMDGRDGLTDGTWFGHTREEIRGDGVTQASTPAFARFTGDAVVDVIRNEGWGEDGVTDFLWVEMKIPDTAGHEFNMVNPEVGDVLAETDAQIARMLDELDRKLGRGNYVFLVTADHGQQPLAEATGGWRISMPEVERDLVAAFGDVVDKVTTADLYLDAAALRRRGVTIEEIARFLGAYALRDSIPPGVPGAGRIPPARLDEPVIAGAFPGEWLRALGDEEIEAFGPGTFSESHLTVGAEGG